MAGNQNRISSQSCFEYNQKGSIIAVYIGEITFDKDWIQPGEEEIVTVSFIPGQSIEKYLTVGTRWWMQEGRRLVAEAEVLAI